MIRSRRLNHFSTGNFRLRQDSPQAVGLVTWWPTVTNSVFPLQNMALGGTFEMAVVNSPTRDTDPVFGRVLSYSAGSLNYLKYDGHIATAPCTLVAWFNCTNTTQNQAIIAINSLTTQFGGIWLQARGADGGDPVVARCSGTVAGVQAATTTGYSSGVWHHGAAVFISPTLRYAYIDGGSKGSNTSNSGTLETNYSNVCIGAINYWGSTNPQVLNYFTGQIGDTRIYNRDLSDAEVAQCYAPDTRWELYEPVVPQWFVAWSGQPITQEGFRFRNDDGNETTATWSAGQDTNITTPLNQNVRLRALLDTPDGQPSTQYQLEYRKVGDTNWRKVV